MLNRNEKKILQYGRFAKLAHWNSQLRNTYEQDKFVEYTRICSNLYSELTEAGISILHSTPENIDFDNLIGIGEEICSIFGTDWDEDWDWVARELVGCNG